MFEQPPSTSMVALTQRASSGLVASRDIERRIPLERFDARANHARRIARVGIAADHGGYALKQAVVESLRGWHYQIADFGAHQLNPDDDYPDFIVPLAVAVATGRVQRGIALCGSGVGASIAANKIHGVRAALIHDVFSAHQGVEDDDMNVFCMGGKVIGVALALELIETFLNAQFSGAARHLRRLDKLRVLENQEACIP
jgi:ribose 5-phosphate isomerase B